MAKQLNVNLAFIADTSQAKAKIQELQNSLTALVNAPTGNFGNKMTKDIQQGIKAAAELKTHLQKATNVETGNLDFSKLNQSIKQSGTSLNEYGQKLQSLGADGQQAFMKLAQSVAASEIPIRRSNAMLTEMWTTLKNTARWQISSSILHGFMGALQSAYGYAQDLNESLNNIRIVTGKNIDEMATFATQANKAAKALSATTTEYTDASLIYYQQGLDGAAVEERAAVTLKMANVSRQSAEVVSDQMTAVWNNFYDGSKSLEYYADVMTALGAATASSTDEISQGLEKFAAVADTVGLSYEYATAALATVTAETRQSADVVGTAFKTLFARIEGLSLGETLDDGTNLNKYSEALLKVGINVKDQNGQLKDMDSILNEMGSKWNTLAKDQQVALAQTVGGVRQYNQLISLMDNWDKFQQNLGTAQGSIGTLQEQADIYAESWEAAQDRVRAAAEAIYSDLLNDEAFIDILNIVEDFLTLIDNIIDSVGGLQGVLTNVGAILLKVFSKQAAQSITNMAYGFQMMTKSGREKIQKERTDFIEGAKKSIPKSNEYTTDVEKAQQDSVGSNLNLQSEYLANAERMSEIELETNKQLIERTRLLKEQVVELQKQQEITNNNISGKIVSLRGAIALENEANPDGDQIDYGKTVQPLVNQIKGASAINAVLQDSENVAQALGQAGEKGSAVFKEFKADLSSINLDGMESGIVDLINDINTMGDSEDPDVLREKIEALNFELEKLFQKNTKQIKNYIPKEARKNVDDLTQSFKKQAIQKRDLDKTMKDGEKTYKMTEQSIKNAKGAQKQWSDTLVQGTQSALSLVSALQSIINLGNIWSDENLTGGQKLLQIITALGTAIPMAIMSFRGLNTVLGISNSLQQLQSVYADKMAIAQLQNAAATLKYLGAQKANNTEEEKRISMMGLRLAAEKLGIEVAEDAAQKDIKKAIAQKLNIELTEKDTTNKFLNAAATLLGKNATDKATTSKIVSTAATIQETLAQWGLNAALSPFIALMLAAVAAIMPYIAAAGLLAGAIALIALAVTEESRALKKAEEQEKQAAESAKRVADEINTINDALNKIQSTTETFKDLEKGTLEWYQALNEVNAEVQMLIDKYPKLLEMGAITIDNGLLGINEQGIEYITQENAKQMTVANNITLRAQQNTAQVKVDQGWNDLAEDNVETYGGITILDQEKAFKTIVASYQAYGDAMFENAEYANYVRENVKTALGGRDLFTAGIDPIAEVSETEEELLEYLNENKEWIINQNEQLKKISQIDNQILMSRMSLAGSLRDAQQSQELMGDVTGAYKQKYGNQKELVYNDPITGDKVAWNMNQNENYGKNGEALPKEIQDFMALQGEDVEYVAQRWGKLVLKINGEKEKFSADQVYDGLKELYDEANFEEELRGKLQEDLNNAFTNITLDDSISADNLIAIDNFRLSLEESVTNLFSDASEEELEGKVNNMLDTIVSAYGTSEESLAAFVQDTSFVDTASRQFQNLTETFQQGKISVDQYKQAIKELNAEGELNSMSAWFTEQADVLGLKEEDAGKMQEYAKNLMELSEESDELSESLASDAQSAADLAVEITRMNKGIDSLADGFEDWSDVIKKSSKASAEYSDAMFEMKSALADVLDVESDLISSDFVEDHLDDIEKAATGDADAIDKLRASMDEEIIANIALGQTEEFKKELNNLDSELQSLVPEDIEVGMVLTGTNQMEQDFLEAANNLVEQAGMTADEANAYFAGIGYEPVYSQEELPSANSMSLPNATTTVGVTGIDWTQENFSIGDHDLPIKMPALRVETRTEPLEPIETKGDMRLTAFSGDSRNLPKIRGMRKKATGSQNNYSSANKGGKAPGSGSKSSSGSGSKNNKKTKKSDVVERYKEITDQLDDVTRATDKASKAADRLYGPARLKAMKDVSKSLKEELNLLEKKSKEVAQNYADDQFHLNSVSKSAGLNFEYDESGNIINYTSEMNKLYNQVAAAEASGDENAIELAQLKVDTITDAIDQYDETRELWEDVADEMDEKFYEWQDNNAAIFEYELEIKLDTNEFENKFLEFEKDLFADDAYSFAESVAATGGLLRNSQEDLQSYSQSFNELQKLFAEGKISQASFMEQLQNLSDGALEKFGDIVEYDKEMLEAYRKQLELNSEELAEYTDQFEHLNAVLDHYQTLMELTGDGQDLQSLQKILDAQARVAADRYIVSLEYYQDKKAEMEELERQLSEATIAGLDTELLEEELKAAREAFQEAEEGYLSDAEANAEAIKNAYVNNLALIKEEFQKALTGGTDFDYLNTQMERLQSTQEEYLTTTNKIYETNKLINQAEKEIDKTSNTVAKSKLKAFQQETSQLQNQGRLSQFELDIQQKKYDLLLAEIALEEAQNAKSTVRLTRDSEGNFGYVYTADQEQIADAQQNVDDAANALYNTQLEGANKYAQQRVELLQAMYEEIEAINENEVLSAEEKDSRIAEIMEYYHSRMESNSELYNIAIQDDIRITQDSWSSNLDIMGQDVGYFFDAAKTYLTQAGEVSSDYRDKMDEIANDVGIASQYMNGSLNAVRQASSDLKDEIVNSLLPAQQKNLENIRLLTSAYAANRTNTDTLKTAYYNLAGAMSAAYDNAYSLEGQLRSTNQAAKLIGGTGWVTWDYTIDDEGNYDSGSSGSRNDEGNKGSTTTSSPAKTYKLADAKGIRDSGNRYIKLNNGYWFFEKDLIYQGGDVYGIKQGAQGGTDISLINANALNGGPLYEIKNVKKFDTGGYTGEWGTEGKLAMLHEKEIILNKEDTKNFLASLELLHNIIKMIDINTSNSLISRLDSADLKTNKSNDILEQHVTIEAVFPSVEDRYEIEEAFMNLTNEASQYINRKNN